MFIRKKGPRQLRLDEPILHESAHKRPVTRRDFIAQGLMTGPAILAGQTLLGLMANPRVARALSPDLEELKSNLCNITAGAGKIPFIAFDLAGGASMVGSEALIGGRGGPLDLLSTAGYAKLGLPGDMVPQTATNDFIDQSLGLPWHSDGAMLRGILEKTSPTTQANTNGVVIAARSENDTGNNPHNPMYGIYKAGADGQLLTLIGSRNTESGGNSMAPASMIDPSVRPTKVDRASDVTGLVDTGELGTLFGTGEQARQDAVAVLEAMTRLSHRKADRFLNSLPPDRQDEIDRLFRCGYVKATYLAQEFSDPSALNPDRDPLIVDQPGAPGTGIFSEAEYRADEEFRKTAAVMKMVINGYAGAGTITMGGYDYHGQGRATGEVRNLRAGRCIGACLEYAARRNKPVMIYIFSDGSLSANGQVDNSVDGRGKFMWASDNQSTAASILLVYSPQGRPEALRQQIGWFTSDGSVDTTSHPGANSVNLLVELVILNYMALHGEAGQFPNRFPNHGLGNVQLRDSLIAFAPIVNGTISS